MHPLYVHSAIVRLYNLGIASFVSRFAGHTIKRTCAIKLSKHLATSPDVGNLSQLQGADVLPLVLQLCKDRLQAEEQGTENLSPK